MIFAKATWAIDEPPFSDFAFGFVRSFRIFYVIRSDIADKGTIIPYTILTIINGAHVEQQNFIFSEDFNYDKILLISLL